VTSGSPTAARLAGTIVSPAYDGAFFILAPLLCLGFASVLGQFAWPFEPTRAFGKIDARVTIFVSIWTYAHLFAVVFRSHANPQIFAKHRIRFTAVPLALFCLLVSSDWGLATAFVVAMVWDIYHSGMQSFGLCRIYDARRGNDPSTGRELDRWLNHFIYAGPALCGVSLIPMLDVAQHFSTVGWDAPGHWAAEVPAMQHGLRAGVIASGGLFAIFYVLRYRALARAGYRFPPLKIALLISTAITSITAWGFLPPLEAFFVVNLFHGLQYFAIVWWAEGANLHRLLGLRDAGSFGSLLAFLAMAVTLFAAGALYFWGAQSSFRAAVAFGLVVSLMHFWYDGFIWSVRRNEV
jgi:hypothetical protein